MEETALYNTKNKVLAKAILESVARRPLTSRCLMSRMRRRFGANVSRAAVLREVWALLDWGTLELTPDRRILRP